MWLVFSWVWVAIAGVPAPDPSRVEEDLLVLTGEKEG